jgi:hypothetical protein
LDRVNKDQIALEKGFKGSIWVILKVVTPLNMEDCLFSEVVSLYLMDYLEDFTR